MRYTKRVRAYGNLLILLGPNFAYNGESLFTDVRIDFLDFKYRLLGVSLIVFGFPDASFDTTNHLCRMI